MNITQHNLLNFSRKELAELFQSWGEPAFRADQVMQWIHQRGVIDFDLMSNLSKSLREKLKSDACVSLMETITDQQSNDGTRKFLFRLYDGNAIETVFIPEKTRGTLCVSSQVGCALNCSFCATGKEGFNRNLSLAEIIGQVFLAVIIFPVCASTNTLNISPFAFITWALYTPSSYFTSLIAVYPDFCKVDSTVAMETGDCGSELSAIAPFIQAIKANAVNNVVTEFLIVRSL